MDTTYIQERENFLSRANKNLEDGLFDEAIALAEERLSSYPGDPDAHIITATCLVRMGNLTRAWEVLSKLDGLIQEWSQAYELLGYIYRKKEMPEEAIRSYKKVLSLNPNSPMKQHISNKIDSLKDNVKEKEEAVERPVAAVEESTGIETRPANLEVVSTSEEAEVKTEAPDGKIEELPDIETEPDAEVTSGTASSEEKEEEDAVERPVAAAGEEAEELGMEDAAEKEREGGGETESAAHDFDTMTLAELYFQQGYHEMARDVLNRILAKDPENTEAREKLKQMESLKDNKWIPVIDELNRWLKNLRRSES